MPRPVGLTVKAKTRCIATGTYQPVCGCLVSRHVLHGSDVPPCPRCKRVVDWLLLVVPEVGVEAMHRAGA
jgi:hypothetical protein